jgi:hypothetical protein
MQTAIFPMLLIALDLGASVVHAVALDWRRALYWLAAAVLTACVTFQASRRWAFCWKARPACVRIWRSS